MSDTASSLERDENGIPLHPTDVLINIVVVLLTPMFLIGANANLELAQIAAMETVNSFRIRNQADLIVVAQVIAFGLTALGSLSLSMGDDVSLPTLLRLRNNAVALNRAEQRQRRILAEPMPQTHAEPLPEPAAEPAPPQPEPPRTVPQTTAPAPTVSKEDARAFAAINAFIQGTSDEIPLPPFLQRPQTGMRAAALGSVAMGPLTGIPPSPMNVDISRGGG